MIPLCIQGFKFIFFNDTLINQGNKNLGEANLLM